MILSDIKPAHEAGLLMIGDPGVSLSFGSGTFASALKGIRIPPSIKQFNFNTECPGTCTNKYIPKDKPLTVVGFFLHGHKNLKSVELRLG